MTQREPLTHAGGPVASEGDPELANVLARALKRAEPEERDLLTHGFHSYAARMHPLLARSVIEALVNKDQRVLDPFCGSGTVLVEAVRAGVQSYGSDINPLALRLSRTKCQLRDEPSRKRFAELLRDIAHLSTERVQARTPILAKLSKQEAQWYAPHVIKELAGLYAEIQKVSDKKDKDSLEILFSAIVVKFSKQQSDTSERKVEKRIRKGLCTEFFQRKGLELIRRWEDLQTESPADAPEPKIVQSDARDVHKKLNQHFDLLTDVTTLRRYLQLRRSS